MRNKVPSPQPIIVKKVFVKKGAHHGGAWKVAYADFVTAMMAFFLLLWLLNSTPSQKLKGIAQYFEPTIGLMNKKSLDKESSAERKTENEDLSTEGQFVSGITYGVKSSGQIVSDVRNVVDAASESKLLENVKNQISHEIEQDVILHRYKEQIRVEEVQEGLLIQIEDGANEDMFEVGSAVLSKNAKAVLDKISKLIQYSTNFIAIGGYTDRVVANSSLGKAYTSWELSVDRANAARRFIVEKGIAEDRIAKVSGYADSAPLDHSDPYSAKNRRVTITLLKNSFIPSYKMSMPSGVTMK